MSTKMQIMGKRIQTARQFRRLTGEQLAEELNISVDSLRHIEHGVRRPSFQLIERISDTLDVSLDYLAGKTESPLEHRLRKELESSGLTKEQEDAVVELAINSIPVIKRFGRCIFSLPHNSTVFAVVSMYYVLNRYESLKTVQRRRV